MFHDLFLAAINTLGLAALCTICYGFVQRNLPNHLLRRIAIGVVLGIGAVIATAQPFIALDTFRIDSRDMFLAFATAFGGVVSTLIALAIAILSRSSAGGDAFFSAVVMMVTIPALTAIWTYITRNDSKRSLAAWGLLGLLLSAPLLFSMAWRGIMLPEAALARLATETVIVFVFGRMFETELRRAGRERQLNKAASTDPLTGLPNRRAMMEFLQALEPKEREGMALLIVDADHFKQINDVHGHAVGDQVLKSLANTLNSAIRQGDFVARFGGEEFAVLLKVSKQNDGYLMASRLCHALSQQHVISGKKVRVTVSVGGTRLPGNAFDFAAAYERADAALYDAKKLGRNQAVFA